MKDEIANFELKIHIFTFELSLKIRNSIGKKKHKIPYLLMKSSDAVSFCFEFDSNEMEILLIVISLGNLLTSLSCTIIISS